MPGMNRKGPEGMGPKTGRGLGRCNGEERAERQACENEMRPGRGRRGFGGGGRGNGAGMGRGEGRGRGQGMGRGRGKEPGRGRRNNEQSEGE